MRRISFPALAVLTIILTGCATSPYGNYLNSTSVDQQKLAREAVQQLATLWPPAKTRLELKQATPDAFGVALTKGLREHGYAVMEFSPKQTAPSHTPDAHVLPLYYVLDQVKSGTSKLYQLTLLVGTESITRPYLEQNGTVVPGYWTHKE
ncbi:conjugal transfer protein TrbH [Methylobacter sp. BBA5.1]|uniref:conjugal transfer protein TrbH n=1 Tax=Methylobacter sp. BBA5.1 TaxID=1495064 RepID=UPI00056C7819|nr:conjugal transfer protein TrbH [Methylobacter sp. BBA5.1]